MSLRRYNCSQSQKHGLGMDEVQIEGYELYSVNRTNRIGVGVALYIKSNLKSK